MRFGRCILSSLMMINPERCGRGPVEGERVRKFDGTGQVWVDHWTIVIPELNCIIYQGLYYEKIILLFLGLIHSNGPSSKLYYIQSNTII